MEKCKLYSISSSICGATTTYHANSNYNNWESPECSKEEKAISFGEKHQKILITIYPELEKLIESEGE